MVPRLISTSSGRPTLRQGELPFLRRSRRARSGVQGGDPRLTTSIALLGDGLRHFGRAVGWRRRADRSKVVGRSIGWLLGFGVDRAEIEGRSDRAPGVGSLGVEQTLEERALGRIEGKPGPTMREFLRVARLDRDSAVHPLGELRPDAGALLGASSSPTTPGRSYRLRPQHPVGLADPPVLDPNNVLAMFEIPDTPETRRLGEAASAAGSSPSRCRRPTPGVVEGLEPDPESPGPRDGPGRFQHARACSSATIRRLRARLEARLRQDLGKPVSVLNTGTLGLLARAILSLLDASLLRPLSTPVRRHQPVRQRLRRHDRRARTGPRPNTGSTRSSQFCRTRGGGPTLAVPLPVELSVARPEEPDSVYPGKLTRPPRRFGRRTISTRSRSSPPSNSSSESRRAFRAGQAFPYSPLFNRQVRRLPPLAERAPTSGRGSSPAASDVSSGRSQNPNARRAPASDASEGSRDLKLASIGNPPRRGMHRRMKSGLEDVLESVVNLSMDSGRDAPPGEDAPWHVRRRSSTARPSRLGPGIHPDEAHRRFDASSSTTARPSKTLEPRTLLSAQQR